MKNLIAEPVRPVGRFAIVGVGAGAVLVGSLVLLGWALDIAVLKSVLPGWVAIKPNTAVAFILIGLAMLFSGRSSPSTVHRFLPRLCSWLAGLIGLLSLAEYAFDWNPGFDQWLFPEPAGAVGTSHLGRMAPDTAICFALLAFGWELARRERQSVSLPVAPLILGALVTTIGLAEVLSCFSPALRTYGWGGLTMMALPTAILFTLLGAALVGSAAPRKASAGPGGSAQPFARTEYTTPIKFLLIFAALAIGIIAAGTSYYRNIERNFVTGVDHQLSAIGDLKVNQLAQWRRERLGDAALLWRNPALAGLVRRYLTQPADADAQHQLQDWLGKYPETFGYEQVRLIDAAGVSRLTIPTERPPPSDFILQRGLATLRTGLIDMVDFYRSAADGRVYLALLVPVFAEANASQPLGVLVLRIDPARYLFPFIQGWPVPSRSAETLLVRREGNEVLYLNDLRFSPQSAMALRTPLDRRDLPAARAVRGETSTMEGSDYRGVPVVAALRAIPDSPWFIVAKVDRGEAYDPIRGQLWEVFAAVVGILFAAGAGVGLVWGEQRGQFYRKQAASAKALRETGQLLADAQAIAKLGGYALDFTSGRWTCSAALDEVLGLDLSSDHTVASWQALIHPDDRTMMADYFNQEVISRKQSFNQEYRIIRPRDGAVRWVHGLGQLQFSADGRLETMRGSIQDITARKQTQEELRKQSEELGIRNDALSRFNNVAVGRELRMIELKQEVNELCAKVGEPPRHRIAEVPVAPEKETPA